MTKLKVIVIMWCLNFLFWCVSGLTYDYSKTYELWFVDFAGASFFTFFCSKVVLSIIMLFMLFDSKVKGREEVE